ncbi:MAG TPA: hypothetical protein VG142_19475 [Trebonia sp.]|jgi:hypothetical protein|nr:hypothetical protein [Trebonia sp.]
MGLSVLSVAAGVGIGPAATAQASVLSARAYAPPPPPPAPPAPGFTGVATSVTVGPAGAAIAPGFIDGAAVTVTVPAGAFANTVQITVTAGAVGTLAPAAFTGYRVVTALGVQVELNGAPYPGTFLKPITVTWRDGAITSASLVTTWNGVSLAIDPSSTSSPGVATVTFDADPDFAILSPVSAAPKPVAGATVPVTGEPLAGEGILAGALLVAGLGGLGISRRRKKRG